MKQYYPTGTANPEDGCQRVSYSYDTNPVNPSFSQNSYGRLTAVQYGMPASAWYMASSFCASGGWMTSYLTGPGTNAAMNNFVEMYSYHPAGAVTAKQVALTRMWAQTAGGIFSNSADVEVDYTYDQAGRPATVSYPMAGGGPLSPPNLYTPMTLTYGYDTMGRPNALTDVSGATVSGATVAGLNWPSGAPANWVQNVQYDYAGRMTLMQYLEGLYPYSGALIEGSIQQSMTYNVNGQLASLSMIGPVSGAYTGSTNTIQYTYSATQNNGQITQAVDGIGGETIVYQYDALKRLTSASSTPLSGFVSPPAAWTQTYQYDGFGNLTGKVLNGATTPIGVNAANNRLSSASYDLNGNMTSGSGATLTYDEANRVSSAAEVSGGVEFYAYAADNRRYYKYTSTGAEQLTFYGAHGENLGVYSIQSPTGPYTLGIYTASTNIWFAGKMILESNTPPMMDRLGTNRAGYAEFYPYGDEITSTANDHEKFATYTRDSYTGFDYADQRFYASTYGRFNTADPYQASGGPSDPGSWNRYSYVGGDPINYLDPRGLQKIISDQGDDGGDDPSPQPPAPGTPPAPGGPVALPPGQIGPGPYSAPTWMGFDSSQGATARAAQKLAETWANIPKCDHALQSYGVGSVMTALNDIHFSGDNQNVWNGANSTYMSTFNINGKVYELSMANYFKQYGATTGAVVSQTSWGQEMFLGPTFFNPSVARVGAGYYAQAQALMMMHEAIHLLGAQFGDAHFGGSQQLTNLLITNCFPVIKPYLGGLTF